MQHKYSIAMLNRRFCWIFFSSSRYSLQYENRDYIHVNVPILRRRSLISSKFNWLLHTKIAVSCLLVFLHFSLIYSFAVATRLRFSSARNMPTDLKEILMPEGSTRSDGGSSSGFDGA